MALRNMNPWDMAAPLYRLMLTIEYPGYRRLYRLIRAYLSPCTKALELGCGPGNITVKVADACRYVTATDYAAGMIAQAQAHHAHSNVEYRQADATALPFTEDSFDVAYTVNMLHVVSNPRAVLAETARVLTPDGRLIAATFTRDGSVRAGLAARLARLIGHGQFFAWNDQTYRDFFADCGWTVRRHTTVRSLFQISVVIATPPLD
ncbi:MAG: class I SAM-dependent methyltransferase [Actinomycetaceae bacterium]|nr:class I SAM-dependent methyltransferase [Actinomycetaceae bacterium]